MMGLRARLASAACAALFLAACAHTKGKMGNLDAGYTDVFREPAAAVRAAARSFLEAERLDPRDDDSLVTAMRRCPGNEYGYLWWRERYEGQWWCVLRVTPDGQAARLDLLVRTEQRRNGSYPWIPDSLAIRDSVLQDLGVRLSKSIRLEALRMGKGNI